MTLEEQRGALIAAMKAGLRDKIHIISGCCATDDEIIKDQLAAISAAGFSIVADEAFDAFELAKVDIARKPK